jgi:hypothetical protein
MVYFMLVSYMPVEILLAGCAFNSQLIFATLKTTIPAGSSMQLVLVALEILDQSESLIAADHITLMKSTMGSKRLPTQLQGYWII